MLKTKEEYFDFMFEYEVGSWKESHDRGMQAFSVTTQHVLGKDKYDVLDKMMAKVESLKVEVIKYNNLPRLKQLIESDTKFTKGAKFVVRDRDIITSVKDHYPMFASEYTSKKLLDIREVGYDYWYVKNMSELLGVDL